MPSAERYLKQHEREIVRAHRDGIEAHKMAARKLAKKIRTILDRGRKRKQRDDVRD